MAVTVTEADTYFQEEVFLNDLWVGSDNDQKSRALKNAENQLYRYYSKFNSEDQPLPSKAVFEQAYFLMLVDETIQKAQHGVTQVSVSGITVSTNPTSYPISPEAKQIVLKHAEEIGDGSLANPRSSVKLGKYAL